LDVMGQFELLERITSPKKGVIKSMHYRLATYSLIDLVIGLLFITGSDSKFIRMPFEVVTSTEVKGSLLR
jgi:hypothetical protein